MASTAKETLKENPLPPGMDFSPFLPTVRFHHPEKWNFVENETKGVYTYFRDYMRYGYAFSIESMIEVGVLCGMTALAVCYGAFLRHGGTVRYLGFDLEAYRPGSNLVAANSLKILPFIHAEILHADTTSPEGRATVLAAFGESRFDLVHVDGDHNEEPALGDCRLLWPSVRIGGLMVVDDLSTGTAVSGAVRRFAAEEKLEFDVVENGTGHALFVKGYRNDLPRNPSGP